MNKQRYVLQNSEMIGQGAYGQIFRVYDTLKGDFVAVKRILKNLRNKSQKQYEIQALQKIYHSENADNDLQYLIKYIDLFEDQQYYYIVMELLEDYEELLELIKKKNISQKLALEIFYQICKGIKALHKLKIIHRDLKPSNILVCLQPLQIKIIDFGFAKELESYLDQFQTVAGSPIYYQ